MTNEQIKSLIKVKKSMLAEYASRMNPLADEGCHAEARLCDLYETTERSIERLERTLAVRIQSNEWRVSK